MRFGNWEITEYGIVGHNSMRRYEITREDLVLLINGEYVDKLIHISQKDGVDGSQLFNLNLAYLYALGKFGIETVTDIHLYNTKQKQLRILGVSHF